MSNSITLTKPVGKTGKSKTGANLPAEVNEIKKALSNLGIVEHLEQNGAADSALTDGIIKFQKLFSKTPDGKIDPKGSTLSKLNHLIKGKAIIVNLHRQKVKAFNAGAEVHSFNCASGDAAHPTPPGYYAVSRKHKEYRSKTYDAQMNYAMFFHGGYAIHMSHAVTAMSYLKWWDVDYFGSHGCVRLPESDASTLFDWTPMDTPVVILPKN